MIEYKLPIGPFLSPGYFGLEPTKNHTLSRVLEAGESVALSKGNPEPQT